MYIYIIDDVPAGFKYDDLYTCILGSINAQKKGMKAELINFDIFVVYTFFL